MDKQAIAISSIFPAEVIDSWHQSRALGRTDIFNVLVAQVPQRRFITLVGPGGIGKTTLALAVAERLSASYDDGIRFVDLAPLTDPRLVPTALAFVVGSAIHSDNPIPGLIAFMRDKRMLLVLDNCEHVVDAAAALAEEVVKGAPGIHILATSREPLRVQGERVQRLEPLGVPAVSAGLAAVEALSYPAVQLFVERAAETLDGFELTDADAPIVADICRRLDGIALAIELAAGRVDAFGVRGLAARLDDRFRLLTRGWRTALPRHQTLSATLDWSYEFLPEPERAVLRRLAVFAGVFTLEAAGAIGASPDIDPADVADHVANLVTKSLIAAEVGGAVAYYRLLDTTRVYCLEKLKENGESELSARRHAEYFCRIFERAEAESEAQPTSDWLAAYASQIDNVRTALDWAFSPSGEAVLGVALTIAAIPLWTHLSLMEECCSRVERALNCRGSAARPSTRSDMQLFTALGAAMRYAERPEADITAALSNALEIAEKLDDADYQLRALWGLWIFRLSDGKFRDALALARRFKKAASKASDPADALVADRMIGLVLHFLGQHAEARQHIENMLSRYVAPIDRSHIIRFQYDQRAMAHNTLAEVLWLEGFPDQAMRIAETSVAEVQSINHELSLCSALALCACPVALHMGDLPTTEHFVAMLLAHSARYTLPLWHAWGVCFESVLRIRRGDVIAALSALRTALDQLPGKGFAMRYTAFLAELAEGHGRAGETAKGRAAIDEALDRCERNEELWCFAELLRIKGEILLREGTSNAATAAEEHFRRAFDWASRQNTLSWELRIAMSLARLQRDQGRIAEAHTLLAPVYDRFTEGFGTADLRAAKKLIGELAGGADVDSRAPS
jgi:predicted ATPase